jgi:hypothetical protein
MSCYVSVQCAGLLLQGVAHLRSCARAASAAASFSKLVMPRGSANPALSALLVSACVQVLHLLLHGLLCKPLDEALLAFMRLDEMLIDIGDDLTDYEDDVMANSFNIYRGGDGVRPRVRPRGLLCTNYIWCPVCGLS